MWLTVKVCILGKIGVYWIIIQAVNEVGIGKSSAPVSAEIFSKDAWYGSKSSNLGTIAGGTVGGIILLVFALLIIYNVRKRILVRQRKKSIKVRFHSRNLSDYITFFEESRKENIAMSAFR